ncbi:MAG: 4Fe-4S dicluster domain-containing protein [Rhodobacteraceae bacterium]|nr:4Fe-4S dicluster domain-containing protein [Paracoccaceae bacterium]
MTAHATIPLPPIADPVSDAPPISRAKLEEIFDDIRAHPTYDHEIHGCLNCGICTATCPSAHYYDYSPREIVQLLWTENLEGIYDAMQEKIWACAQCYTCAARCPFENSPGGLVMILREVAIQHDFDSVKEVLRPFSRVLLKVVSTGNQLAPNMITKEAFPDWGPNVAKVDAPLAILRKAIPMPTMHTHGHGVGGEPEDVHRALHDLGSDRRARPARDGRREPVRRRPGRDGREARRIRGMARRAGRRRGRRGLSPVSAHPRFTHRRRV